ncbi:MAG: DNA internalization-related competence protein ComEC/Rec2 [Magnetococcales bacterium]|nr:DNA internalization-related competence protein ComEC/Rec2 [Magnetococcales bacterium]NGZ04771.1 DNA internalization-related competence protein ComEC/Rec2 [Magnetococcales bacterium]
MSIAHDLNTRPPLPLSSLALFLAWMLVGLIATLPGLSTERVTLVLIALIPAGAAGWSSRHRGEALFWIALAGFVWGLVAVWGHTLRIPEATPASIPGVTIQATVADREDRNDSVLLTLDGITSESWNPSGQLRLSLHHQTTPILPGDRIRAEIRVRPLGNNTNPGGFDYRQYQRDMGIIATATTKHPVERIDTTDQWFWNRLRQQIADWITTTLPPAQSPLAEALLLGKRGHLDGSLQNALYASGTYHLVAISGLHLSLVAGTVFFLIRLLLTLILPLSRRWDMKRPAALITLMPVTIYACLAGWSVSTQRAYIMVGLFLLALLFRRYSQTWRILTLSAILILSWQPGQLLNAGFQLSFLCVAIILYLIDHMPRSNWQQRLLFSLACTVSIGLITAPVAQYAFHRISPYGMGINLLAIPWVGELSTPLGLMAMVLHPIWPEGADGLLRMTGWTLERFRDGIEWSVTWPGAERRTPGPSLTGLALFLALGAVTASLRHTGRWRWRPGVLGLLALIGLAWPRQTTPADHMRLIVLDVGQALSVIAKTPSGGWTVIDAGGAVSPRYNVGEAVVSAALWHHGVHSLERVILTHPQQDHISGMNQLLHNFSVGELWIPELPKELEQPVALTELLATAKRLHIPVRQLNQPETMQDGTAQLRILPPLPKEQLTKRNDLSLTIEITHGQHRFLITGDMEAKQEKWLLTQNALQPVTMLTAPHHGSLTSSTPHFVQTVRPEHVVFSVGRENPWGFPKEEILQRWGTTGAQLWRTDLDGAMAFLSNGRTLQVSHSR